MKASKVLLILGHPSGSSYCSRLLEEYEKGLSQNNVETKRINLGEMNFDPNLGDGYKGRSMDELEPDLRSAQELISWATHIVLVYPTWWGTMPALTKGFIDRTFLPGFAFKYREGKPFPQQLMKGKSIRIICTMDSPRWWFNLVYRRAAHRMLKQVVFGFVGFKPIKFTTIGRARKQEIKLNARRLNKVYRLGLKIN